MMNLNNRYSRRKFRVCEGCHSVSTYFYRSLATEPPGRRQSDRSGYSSVSLLVCHGGSQCLERSRKVPWRSPASARWRLLSVSLGDEFHDAPEHDAPEKGAFQILMAGIS